MRCCYAIFLSLFFSVALHLPAQDVFIDSLIQALGKAAHDTARCNILSLIAENADDQTWPVYNEKLLGLAEQKIKETSEQDALFKIYNYYAAEAMNNKGYLLNKQGDSESALQLYRKSLAIRMRFNEKPGEARCLMNIGTVYHYRSDFLMALEYYEKALAIQKSLNSKKDIAFTLNNIGGIYAVQAELLKALEYYNKSLAIRAELNDKAGMAQCMSNIAAAYQSIGDIEKSLNYNFKCLKMFEEAGDQFAIANSLHNIGAVYFAQKDYRDAQDFYLKSLEIKEKIKDPRGTAYTLNSIGQVFLELGDTKKAIEYTLRSKKLRDEIGDKKGIAHSLSNLAAMYNKRGQTDSAIYYYTTSLKLRESMNERQGIALCLNKLGEIYYTLKDYSRAKDLCMRALKISTDIGYPENMRNAAHQLYIIYKETGEAKKAYDNYLIYIRMNDSLSNEANRKAGIKSQLSYEYEKRAAADSARYEEEQKITAALVLAQKEKLKQDQSQSYYLMGGLGFVLIAFGFIFNRFRTASKQKKIIEEQKRLVSTAYEQLTVKNKEVLDSIQYARRIQSALMTSELQLEKLLTGIKKQQRRK